ncbi:MAG TPA: UDP-N-acetylglucosamine 2-epimerase (non-hydrolyzing) [Azospirillaceae bacterium]|nr:UDP-N-acetylglucosamine 2-epimerase (non-hydrolyzing) [Azospirillaceae bacterium]
MIGRSIRILTVLGTRPEAIKLAPLVALLEQRKDVIHAVCSTGQQKEMLEQALELFRIRPRFDLNVSASVRSLPHGAAAIISGVGDVLADFPADLVIVQGDTSSALGGAMAAHLRGVPVAHVEAGLRTGNLKAPWPEEGNRRMIAPIASWHFAPTRQAAANLLAEGVDPATVTVTGNTGIDTLLDMRRRLGRDRALRADCQRAFPFLDPAKRMILVTGHRRENFGPGLERVFDALAALSLGRDVQIVYPVHLNPNVAAPAERALGELANVHLIGPQPYHRMIHLMERAHLIITDSGGIQEEAPTLGVPVLVTREVTERPEALDAGSAILVGTDPRRIVREAEDLLNDPDRRRRMAGVQNPFGDGRASERIVAALVRQRTVPSKMPEIA